MQEIVEKTEKASEQKFLHEDNEGNENYFFLMRDLAIGIAFFRPHKTATELRAK